MVITRNVNDPGSATERPLERESLKQGLPLRSGGARWQEWSPEWRQRLYDPKGDRGGER
jgi:hypothetical protein